jgi:branched-chain amino acid transport system substrate-binding protein
VAVFQLSRRVIQFASMGLVAALLLISGLLAGCDKEQAAQSVKIGVVYPLSGSLAATGAGMQNAVNLAVDIVNQDYDLNLPLAPGLGLTGLKNVRLEVILADSQGTPEGGRAAVQKLVGTDHVAAVMGCFQSAVTAEASLAAEELGIPFLADTSTAPSLTKRGFKWFFRNSPGDDVLTRNFFEFFPKVQEQKKGQVKTLALVHESSTWGTELTEIETQYARDLGYTIVADIAYDANTTNVDNEVRLLIAANPTVVLHSSYTNDAILFMQTYQKLGFQPEAILANGAGFLDPNFLATVGDEADNIITRELWCKDLSQNKPLAGTVNQMYRDRFGTDLDGNSARAFTGLLVLADAINRAADTAPEAIREALLKTDIGADQTIMPWGGVHFDDVTQQNTLAKGIICQLQDGQFYTIWPQSLESRDFVWPRPRVATTLKVGIVVNTLEDDFNKGGLDGARKAAAEFGGEMEYQWARSAAEEEAYFNEYAASGQYSLIIAMGGTQTPALLKVAARYPWQKFALVDGDVTDQPNIVSLQFRDQESSFLAGALASIMSYTGQIGFIGGIDVPSIRRFQAGYTAGALYIDAECVVMAGYTGTWADRAAGKKLALDQYDRGADVVFGAAGLSSLGIIEAAQEEGFWAIGADSDQRYRAPDYVLVSTLKMVDVVVYDIIRQVKQGVFSPGLRSFGLAEGGVDISLDNALPDVTDETKEYVKEIKADIIAGVITVPAQ